MAVELDQSTAVHDDRVGGGRGICAGVCPVIAASAAATIAGKPWTCPVFGGTLKRHDFNAIKYARSPRRGQGCPMASPWWPTASGGRRQRLR